MEKVDELEVSVRDLARDIRELKGELQKLDEKVSGVVTVYERMEAAVTLGVTIQKFGLWLVRWPLIITGVLAAITYIKDRWF